MMKLDMVGIITKDLPKSIAFYQTLGFVQTGEGSADYVELDNQGVRLSLNTTDMVTTVYGFTPETVGDKIELAFLCDSPAEVDAVYHKIKTAGYTVHKAPWNAVWGQRYAIIKDVDGHLLSLFAPLD